MNTATQTLNCRYIRHTGCDWYITRAGRIHESPGDLGLKTPEQARIAGYTVQIKLTALGLPTHLDSPMVRRLKNAATTARDAYVQYLFSNGMRAPCYLDRETAGPVFVMSVSDGTWEQRSSVDGAFDDKGVDLYALRAGTMLPDFEEMSKGFHPHRWRIAWTHSTDPVSASDKMDVLSVILGTAQTPVFRFLDPSDNEVKEIEAFVECRNACIGIKDPLHAVPLLLEGCRKSQAALVTMDEAGIWPEKNDKGKPIFPGCAFTAMCAVSAAISAAENGQT